jgi:hypothetical protein
MVNYNNIYNDTEGNDSKHGHTYPDVSGLESSQIPAHAGSPVAAQTIDARVDRALTDTDIGPVKKGAADAASKEKARCVFCKKKTLLICVCKCGASFCLQHRAPEVHECTFDHRDFHRQELAKNNPRIVAEKIKKI